MNSNTWLQTATNELTASGIDTARLDALVLLEDVTNKDRTHLLAHPELELTDEQIYALNSDIERRAQHEPLAYIRGKSEFYGREFTVNQSVLEPRPESETIIELLKQLPLPESAHVADIGSGSGALGITAQLELPHIHVDLLELSDAALEVSKLNSKHLAPQVNCISSNLLENVGETKYDAILANLPYVPEDYEINKAAKHEPAMALFGGFDGLDLYRTMFAQLAEHTNQSAFVLTESLPFQHTGLLNIAKAQKFELYQNEGLVQVFQRTY